MMQVERSTKPPPLMAAPRPAVATLCVCFCLVGAGLLLGTASTRLRGLLENSLLLATLVCSTAIPIGTFLALVIGKTNLPGRSHLQRVLLAMLLVPLFVQAAGWQAALGPTGWLLRGSSYYTQGMLSWGWLAAVLVHAAAGVPWVTFIVLVVLKTIPRELEESALQDASPLRVLRSVTLYRCLPGIAAAALWLTAICFTEISVTDLFQVRTFAEEVYTSASIGSLSIQLAGGPAGGAFDLFWSELARAILLVALLLAAAGIWLSRRLTIADLWTSGATWNWDLGREKVLLTAGSWILLIAVAGIPLVSLAVKAGGQTSPSDQGDGQSWSAAKAATLTVRSPWEHRREIGWSLVIGCGAAALATAVSLGVAAAVRTGLLPRWPLILLAALLFIVPGPLVGVGLIALLNHSPNSAWSWLNWWYDYTILAPLLAQFVRTLPLVAVLLGSHLASVPQQLFDSARSEGAGWPQLLGSIVVPLCWPTIVACFGLALVVSLGELAATLLVLPPGVSTLATRVFGLLHYGAEDRVAAVCLGLAVLSGSLSLAIAQLLRLTKRNLDKCEPR